MSIKQIVGIAARTVGVLLIALYAVGVLSTLVLGLIVSPLYTLGYILCVVLVCALAIGVIHAGAEW